MSREVKNSGTITLGDYLKVWFEDEFSPNIQNTTRMVMAHMYATILIENGASLSKISALLGHSSINTTFEYYCDISDESNNIKAFMDNTFIPEEEAD